MMYGNGTGSFSQIRHNNPNISLNANFWNPQSDVSFPTNNNEVSIIFCSLHGLLVLDNILVSFFQ